MEQKINEENIDNNLVFCIDFRKAFASNLWWHISTARYEIAIVKMLENFHENSKFPGNFT